ncbi:MAG: hypothetical protein LBK66_05055 [Spirochaetaceae bacterium]|jgi:hypothetical protein|nr:hypothetical protein [Spirochaetaceae bacterium]
MSGGDVVLPLMPEMIRNESGAPDEAKETDKKSYEEQKQDCDENNNVLKNCVYHLEHNVETKFPTGTVKTMRARYIAF